MSSTQTQIIAACRAGDRQAFAEIVTRYHRLVCSVAYSVTGDLAASEDLCQETFLTAWRKLGELREADKLGPWICGIARNLARNAGRARQAQHAAHRRLTAAETLPAPSPTPEQQAIIREEQALLWRSLHQIPQEYREPLVLYYRQERSVAEVADAMDLSEDAVRQRLSRGRRMLEEHLATFIESALHRSAPPKTLAIAIVAALPALVPQTAAASVGLVAAKGSATAKAAGIVALSGAIFGPLLGLLGAYIGVRSSLRNARSQREHAYLVRSAWMALAFVAVFAGVLTLTLRYVPTLSRPAATIVIVAFILTYIAGLLILVAHANRRLRQIQQEDGTYAVPHPMAATTTRGAIFASLSGGIFGSMAWIIALGVVAHDWVTVAAAATSAVAIFAAATTISLRTPRLLMRISATAVAAIGVIELLILNLRWSELKSATAWDPVMHASHETPLWAMNLAIALVCTMVCARLLLRDRHLRRPR